MILQGDSKIELKKVQDNSVDMLCTDPPYGYSFMNKGWDKVLPDVDIWKESYRVLKEGSFICVMAAPRSDVLWRLCRDLEGAGFDLSFSNIEWVYHTGFPKASDTSKSIDKRGKDGSKYEGSKFGFQPKPAREIIIVGMKPFKEKSYIDKVLNFEELPENIQRTYPLIQTPKPSKKEKDMGLSGEEKERAITNQNKKCVKCNKWELSGYGESCDCNKPEYKHAKSKNTHPTVKPIKLMSYLITLFTREGDYVLDPFMGSGTTGLACKLLNREFIGIDFTEEYCNIAEERLQVSRGELIKTLKIQIQNELF
jgi:site-specific DNA-methyltransferase (adenine-specific)